MIIEGCKKVQIRIGEAKLGADIPAKQVISIWRLLSI
jgi:hypothetical protein